jgi:hypothetical protein
VQASVNKRFKRVIKTSDFKPSKGRMDDMWQQILILKNVLFCDLRWGRDGLGISKHAKIP